MAADAELGVMLEPTNDLQDEVDDVSVGVNGSGGGGMNAAEQEQQESVIAGGLTEGLAAAGVIGAILSQLKSVTGLVSAVLGFFSRALLPTIEVIADLIRPLISGINDFISAPGETVEQAGQGLFNQLNFDVLTGQENAQFDFFGTTPFNNQRGGSDDGSGFVENAANFFNFGGPESADQTGEATKNKFKQAVDDAQKDKTGSLK